MSVPRHKLHAQVGLEARRIIVYQSEVLKYSNTDISIHLDVPVRTVQRVLQRWRVLGDVIVDPTRGGPHRTLSLQESEVSQNDICLILLTNSSI